MPLRRLFCDIVARGKAHKRRRCGGGRSAPSRWVLVAPSEQLEQSDDDDDDDAAAARSGEEEEGEEGEGEGVGGAGGAARRRARASKAAEKAKKTAKKAAPVEATYESEAALQLPPSYACLAEMLARRREKRRTPTI